MENNQDIFDQMNRDQLRRFIRLNIDKDALTAMRSDNALRQIIRSHYDAIGSVTLVLLKDGVTSIIVSREEGNIRFMNSDYSMMTGANSLAELIESNGIMPACSCCGNIYKTTWVEPVKKQMLERNVCHTCNNWIERLAILKQDKGNTLLANGHYYTIEPDTDRGFKGFGGAEFVFEKDGKTIVSHNVWYGGKVPEHMSSMFVDNAKRISPEWNC